MRYETSQPVIGDIDKAVEAAKEAFADSGFEVLDMGHRTFQVNYETYSGGSTFNWVLQATVSSRSGILWLEAELVSARQIAMIVLVLDVLVLVYLIIRGGFDKAWKIWLVVLAASPPVFVLYPRLVLARTRKRLARLLKDAAAQAEGA